MKYYAVAKGRNPGIYLSWEECKKEVDAFSNAKFKSFNNKEEAEEFFQKNSDVKISEKKEKNNWYVVKYNSNRYNAVIFDNFNKCKKFIKNKNLTYQRFDEKQMAIQFAGCRESKIRFELTPDKDPRICLLCEKPYYGKTKLCPTCNKLRGNRSVGSVVMYKKKHPEQNILKILKEKPYVLDEIYRNSTREERAEIRKQKTIEYKSKEYLSTEYEKTDICIPDYVKAIFEKDVMKELLYIEGDKLDPKWYYKCKRCGKEQCQTYMNLKCGKGHNCDAKKSSGEVIIEEYLKVMGVQFRTQFSTLECRNPRTGKVMPYDFEIRDKKILIEVQGEQHSSYTPYFHGSIENFEYQVWKDEYKKQYAQKFGYKIIEIWYSELANDQYKTIINAALISGKTKN